MTITFYIVDGDDDYLELVPDFVKMYNNRRVKIQEIKSKLMLSKNKYNKLRKYCLENGLIVSRKGKEPYPKPRSNPRYYHKTMRGDNEYWQIDKRGVYYCCVDNVREAEFIVGKLKECDWDKSQLDKIRECWNERQE